MSGWSFGGLVRKLTRIGGSEALDYARTGTLKGKDAQETWKNIKLWQFGTKWMGAQSEGARRRIRQKALLRMLRSLE